MHRPVLTPTWEGRSPLDAGPEALPHVGRALSADSCIMLNPSLPGNQDAFIPHIGIDATNRVDPEGVVGVSLSTHSG